MAASKEDMLKVSGAVGYEIPDEHLEDYTTLLGRMKGVLETLSAMDGKCSSNPVRTMTPLLILSPDYTPSPDLTSTPRKNVHFPQKSDNPLNAWAWRCDCTHTSPSSELLKGKTVCLKDNIALAHVPCLLGTESFTDWTPVVDATVATRILEAGGTIAGKAVCENLSRGAVSVSAATGPVHNPYAHGYSAGGSSSGTAALVASGAADMGLGCDQGGSIRIPAAMCGLWGMKATLGLVPYTGIASNDASVDFVGPMTRTGLDCATLLQAIAGVDGFDDRQIAGCPFPEQVPKYADELRQSGKDGARGLRIGILKEALSSPVLEEELKDKFLAAAKQFENLGATVEEVSVPLHESARTIYSVMSKMGNHMGMLGRATGRRQLMMTDLFEKKNFPYTQDALSKMSVFSKEGLFSGELGWTSFPYAYSKAVNLSRKLKDDYDAALKDFDILVMPTTLRPSFPIPAVDASPVEHIDANKGMTENTAAFNASGHPALAMPIGFIPSKADPSIKVPASMQIVGRFWEEGTILKAAYAWEQTTDWNSF
ncbi:putative Amidase signature domain-containing protein [Seiridium cardinale]|uniref:Amidase signature domain-containing protein n=1 Tax=Seiridium cardinale TaxID=138064 RepID=A0ABR2Y6G6_9PEZI